MTENLLGHVKERLGIGDADDANASSSAAPATVEVAEPPLLEPVHLQTPKETFTCLTPLVPELMALAGLSVWQARIAMQYILRANG